VPLVFHTHDSYAKDVNCNVRKDTKTSTIQYQPQSQSATLKDM
jgi:hypothetical protein